MTRRLPHPSITEDRITALCMRQLTTTDNPGVCLNCGEEAYGCEPDAEGYTCESCGESCVMGADQILIAGCYHPDPKPVSGSAATTATTTTTTDDDNANVDLKNVWPGSTHDYGRIDIEDET